jgi:hypothetical protein
LKFLKTINFQKKSFQEENPKKEEDVNMEEPNMTPESMPDLQSAKALMRYYGDATRFCLMIQSAVPTLCDL